MHWRSTPPQPSSRKARVVVEPIVDRHPRPIPVVGEGRVWISSVGSLYSCRPVSPHASINRPQASLSIVNELISNDISRRERAIHEIGG